MRNSFCEEMKRRSAQKLMRNPSCEEMNEHNDHFRTLDCVCEIENYNLHDLLTSLNLRTDKEEQLHSGPGSGHDTDPAEVMPLLLRYTACRRPKVVPAAHDISQTEDELVLHLLQQPKMTIRCPRRCLAKTQETQI